ncbi:protein FAM184A [Octopus bimaculoides]|nr:protein FAM184A [Octopus bimaculoides]
MATGSTRMSYSNNFYQQQNVKFATLPHGSSTKDGDLTYDMHHKMSKKIAQLTKRKNVLDNVVLDTLFEMKMGCLQIDLMKELKDKHHSVIEELHKHYQEEIKTLLDAKNIKEHENMASDQQITFYKDEAEHWKNEVSDFEQAKSKLNLEWETKISQMKDAHMEQISLLIEEKNKELKDSLHIWMSDKGKLDQESSKVKEEFSRKVEHLESEISRIQEESDKYKSQLALLKKELEDRDDSTSNLNSKLEESQVALSEEHSLCKLLQEEAITKDSTIKRQQGNILKLSATVSDLEASRVQRETEIRSLRQKLDEHQVTITDLETVKRKLQVLQEDSEAKSAEMQQLKKMLHDANSEKMIIESQMDENTHEIKIKYEEEKEALIKQKEAEIALMKEAEQKSIMKIQNDMLDKFQKQKEEFDKEIQQLKQQNKSVVEEFEKIGQELKSQLTNAEVKLQNFQLMVRNSEENLSSASSHITTLKDGATRLKEELDACRTELKASKLANNQLRNELAKQQANHKNELLKCEAAHQKHLKTVCDGLEAKSKESLRLECNRVRELVIVQKETEKREALDQMSHDKDAEIKAACKGWEDKVAQLQQEIFSLQSELSNAVSRCAIQIEEEKTRFRLMEGQFERDALSFDERLKQETERLNELQKTAINEIHLVHKKDMQEFEAKLIRDHQSALQALQLAHVTAQEKITEEHKQALLQQEKELQKQHEKNIECLQEDLYQKHRNEISLQLECHLKEISRLKEELQKILQTSKQKDRDHQVVMSELKNKIDCQEKQFFAIEEEKKKLKETIAELMVNVNEEKEKQEHMREFFSQEKIELKEHFDTVKKQELENIEEDYVHEMQKMVTEFSRTQELMTTKITSLNSELVKAEEKYSNRESRPEDLEEIHHLRDEIHNKEPRQDQNLLPANTPVPPAYSRYRFLPLYNRTNVVWNTYRDHQSMMKS